MDSLTGCSGSSGAVFKGFEGNISLPGANEKVYGEKHTINMHSIFSYSCHQTLHVPYHYFNAGT